MKIENYNETTEKEEIFQYKRSAKSVFITFITNKDQDLYSVHNYLFNLKQRIQIIWYSSVDQAVDM